MTLASMSTAELVLRIDQRIQEAELAIHVLSRCETKERQIHAVVDRIDSVIAALKWANMAAHHMMLMADVPEDED